MDIETLIETHPELYHMADPRNFSNILWRGLYSTSALLDLFEIAGEDRAALESCHRPESVAIRHPKHGVAIVRDQKPMSHEGVERSLETGTAEEFFRFLNGRVFFWLTPERLTTMNSAAAYRNIDQVVFVIHTEKLARAYEHRILLSPINSGATKPMPHPRSISMFKAIKDFDWNMKRPLRNRVVELTVLHSVPDIMKHVSRIEVWRGGTLQRTLRAPYREDYFAPKR